METCCFCPSLIQPHVAHYRRRTLKACARCGREHAGWEYCKGGKPRIVPRKMPADMDDSTPELVAFRVLIFMRSMGATYLWLSSEVGTSPETVRNWVNQGSVPSAMAESVSAAHRVWVGMTHTERAAALCRASLGSALQGAEEQRARDGAAWLIEHYKRPYLAVPHVRMAARTLADYAAGRVPVMPLQARRIKAAVAKAKAEMQDDLESQG